MGDLPGWGSWGAAYGGFDVCGTYRFVR
jgi:hypothetical protein